MKAAPIIAAAAVSTIGLKRVAPASISAGRSARRPAPARWRMKSTSRIELRTMMPASAMKPIIEVAVNGAPSSPMAEHDADQRQRHGRQDDQRQLERAELRDDEQIDAEDRDAEGRAHVAERHIGDLPLAVPQQRRTSTRRAAGRDSVISGVPALPQSILAERVVDGEHAVDRRLEAAGEFAPSPSRRSGRCGGRSDRSVVSRVDLDDVAEFDIGALARRAAGRQRRREQALVERQPRSSAAPR